jgi:cell wall-associated NlpC family hydrolase
MKQTLQAKTREAVLQIAQWQLGVQERPAGSNRVKYAEEYGLNGYAWCMMFVWWVFREAGFNLRKTASCTELTNAYKKAGQWVTNGFKPGDIVMFDFSGRKKITEDCGIVLETGAQELIVIEGNTDPNNDANGGCVMKRTRKLGLVTGACRPLYNMEK